MRRKASLSDSGDLFSNEENLRTQEKCVRTSQKQGNIHHNKNEQTPRKQPHYKQFPAKINQETPPKFFTKSRTLETTHKHYLQQSRQRRYKTLKLSPSQKKTSSITNKQLLQYLKKCQRSKLSKQHLYEKTFQQNLLLQKQNERLQKKKKAILKNIILQGGNSKIEKINTGYKKNIAQAEILLKSLRKHLQNTEQLDEIMGLFGMVMP